MSVANKGAVDLGVHVECKAQESCCRLNEFRKSDKFFLLHREAYQMNCISGRR